MLTEFKDLGSKSLSIVNQSVPIAEWVTWTFTNCSSYGFIDFTDTVETAASIKFLDPTSGATLATASLTSGTPVVNAGYSTIKVKITNTQVGAATFNGEIRVYDINPSDAAGLTTQVQFNDSGVLAGDSGLTFNKTTNALTVLGVINAGASDAMTVNGVAVTANVQANSDTLASIESHTHSNTAGVGAYFYGARSRGTRAAPLVVQNGDVLGGMYFVGYDGTDYSTSSAVVATVNATPGANDMPGKLSFQTSADGAQTLTERMGVNAAGLVTVASLTASELLASDASKGLVSLAVASYPSLTEIAYVKGVTSALQTQLNAKAASGANTDLTSVYLNNTGLKIKDTNASHGLSIVPGSDLSADRVLTVTTGDAARTVTLSGDTTLANWFDQSVKAAASPTFVGATYSGLTASKPVGSGASKELVSLTSISASYITGQTAGSNPAAGLIGEVIEVTKTTSTSGSATLGTYTDSGLGTFTLTAGIWTIFAKGVISISSAAGAGAVGAIAILSLTDNSNNILEQQWMGLYNDNQTNGYAGLTIQYNVAISGSTTYKLRFCCIANTGVPTIGACSLYSDSTVPIKLSAFRRG